MLFFLNWYKYYLDKNLQTKCHSQGVYVFYFISMSYGFFGVYITRLVRRKPFCSAVLHNGCAAK